MFYNFSYFKFHISIGSFFKNFLQSTKFHIWLSNHLNINFKRMFFTLCNMSPLCVLPFHICQMYINQNIAIYIFQFYMFLFSKLFDFVKLFFTQFFQNFHINKRKQRQIFYFFNSLHKCSVLLSNYFVSCCQYQLTVRLLPAQIFLDFIKLNMILTFGQRHLFVCSPVFTSFYLFIYY